MSSVEENKQYSFKMLFWPLLQDVELVSFFRKLNARDNPVLINKENINILVIRAISVGWFKLDSIEETNITPESLFGISPDGHYKFLWELQ